MSDKELRNIDRKYLDSLTDAEVRDELRTTLTKYYGILDALRDLPELPHPLVLTALSHAAKFPDDWHRGKDMQREKGLDELPPTTECEMGAGFWSRLRLGLVKD